MFKLPLKMPSIQFKNIGFIKTKLSNNVIQRLKMYIRHKNKKVNKDLAGNISNSYSIEDKNNFFFDNVLASLIDEHINSFGITVPGILTKNCRYKLHRFWVNFQKKYEFNPIHNHSGAYSFVVWIKIPSSYKKESKLPFTKNSNSNCPNTFQFLFTDSLGKISHHGFNLEPEDEGTLLLFNSQMNHCVYPFYLSNQERISVSGNIYVDPEDILPILK